MKAKSVIAYCILAIYSSVLAHSFIPHDHCIHYFDQVMVICVHEGQDHAGHDFPYHDESQYADEYTGRISPASQSAFYPAVTDCPAQAPDFTAPVSSLAKQTPDFVPPKIPSQYSDAFPLRAPPAV